MEFDLENPLTDFHDLHSDAVTSLFLIESDHMPSENYLFSLQAEDFDTCVRQEVMTSISKFSCGFDPLVSYLAVNYLDRFFSSHGLLQPKQWVVKLLAISCVSLAVKMKKTEFSLSDFQVENGIIFDVQTIQRMEFLILGVLEWRMRSITPFSFISFFVSFFKHEDPPFRRALKSRATEIIFKAQNDVKFMVFKPSIISAAALLFASHELFPLQYPCFQKALSSCSYVNKENLMKCYYVMEATLMEGYGSVLEGLTSSVTPVNVLDHNFSKSESEKTNGEGISTTTSTSTQKLERRKINDYRNNHTVQISQIQRC